MSEQEDVTDIELVFDESEDSAAEALAQSWFSKKERLTKEKGLSLKSLATKLREDFRIESIVLSVQFQAQTGGVLRLLISAGGSAGCTITLRPRE